LLFDPQLRARALVPAREVAVHKAASLAQDLARDLGMPVRLSVTDNRSTMISFRRAPSALRLRLHHMFLDAPGPVVQAVADYAGRAAPGRRVLDEFIKREQPRIRQERDDSDERFSPRAASSTSRRSGTS
jgi:hypothetical protein